MLEKKFGVNHPALLPIPLTRVLIDILHLQLRICERFLLCFGRSWLLKASPADRFSFFSFSSIFFPFKFFLFFFFFCCSTKKAEQFNNFLENRGIPALELNEESGLFEMKTLYTGNAISHLKTAMPELMTTFGITEGRAWNLFCQCMEILWGWEKCKEQMKVVGSLRSIFSRSTTKKFF